MDKTEVAGAGPPAWRRVFDGVERRLSPPLTSATSSPELQVATQLLRRAKGAVVRPVDGIVSRGLHLAGLPSYADVRYLKRQLAEVQREVLALRRQLPSGHHDEGDAQ
jgi:hypothetical protein